MSPDLDPNFGLPLWRAIVRYFRVFPPVVQAPQRAVRRRSPAQAPKLGRLALTGRRAANASRFVRIAGLR